MQELRLTMTHLAETHSFWCYLFSFFQMVQNRWRPGLRKRRRWTNLSCSREHPAREADGRNSDKEGRRREGSERSDQEWGMLASLVQGNFIPPTKILFVMIMCSHLVYFILVLRSCPVYIFDSSPVCFVTLVPEM